ncbi:MAG: metal-dependent transcriptional regulator [Anaerolineales bacterium]|nr:metal-dependent transcriptional regulator [Anaerolineales bacterium]
MREQLTHAIEDYLKAIYKLSNSGGRVTTTEIATQLNVTPASVTGMVQRLASNDPSWVNYQKHRGVSLTPKGEHVALEIIRHHRLIEMFLHEILGYPWEEVHDEAERLEHVISEKFEERIAEVLGNPTHDPHGDPIPTRDLKILPACDTRLSDLRPDQHAVVMRVNDSDPDLLRHLAGLGLKPETKVSILEYSPFDENLMIHVQGQPAPVILGRKITQQVFVDIL